MNTNEIYKEYLKTLNERIELETKIEDFVEKWKNGETSLSNESIQQAMEKGYERLEALKKQVESFEASLSLYDQKENDKKMADISVQYHLRERPTNMNVIGGVLSSNANESHLVAEPKSPKQLKQEKNQMLANIKSKVQSGEISLAKASKLTHDVNTAFSYYDEPTETNTNGIHR